MTTFLSDIVLAGANDIQFKNTSGASTGKIESDGNNLVLSNAVGDILLGDGASDVYIGDGTSNVDILFEQSGSIKAEDGSSGVTLTLGSSDTTLSLTSPTITGTITDSTNSLAFLAGAQTFTGQKFFDAGFDAHPIMLSGSQNFDNIDRSGFYNLYNAASGSTNAPPNAAYGTMIAIGNDKGSQGFGMQLFHQRTGGAGQLQVRGMNDSGSAWTSWNTVYTASDTAAVANGASTIATGDQIYDFVTGLNYLPKSGGTITKSSSHVSGNITAANAHLDLFNSLEANTDQKGSIITFTDNYYGGSSYNKTTRAAIKGGTDTVGNTADGYLEFYTDSSGGNSPTLALRLDKDQNATFAGTIGSGAITSTGQITGTELEGTSLDINGNADISGNLTGVDTLTATTLSVTNYGLASGDIPNNAANTTGVAYGLNGAAGSLLTAPAQDQLLYTGQISNGVSGLFAASDNSNSVITLNRHPGNYDSQLGFSSNGSVYYRKFSNAAINTSQAWKTMAFTDSDISGNAGTVTNGVYTTGDQTIGGNKTFSNNLTVEGTTILDSLQLEALGDYITFYGGNSTQHSITSRQLAGGVGDDLRFNTYGSYIINLDSNNNQSSAANSSFYITKHGGADGDASGNVLFDIDGENGDATFTGNVTAGSNSLTAGSLDINGAADISGDLTVAGSQYFNGLFIEGDGKEMFRYSDLWLRINEDNDFSSGIYCGSGILRTDGEFQIGGSGSSAKITSSGDATFAGTVTANGTTLTGTQTSVSGSSGSCTGNAATVTNGVYTTGDQTIAGVKTFNEAINKKSLNFIFVANKFVNSTANETYFSLGDTDRDQPKGSEDGVGVVAVMPCNGILRQVEMVSSSNLAGRSWTYRLYRIPSGTAYTSEILVATVTASAGPAGNTNKTISLVTDPEDGTNDITYASGYSATTMFTKGDRALFSLQSNSDAAGSPKINTTFSFELDESTI